MTSAQGSTALALHRRLRFRGIAEPVAGGHDYRRPSAAFERSARYTKP